MIYSALSLSLSLSLSLCFSFEIGLGRLGLLFSLGCQWEQVKQQEKD
ncbi:MAG: hypothetical protein J8272_00815 ['Prunus persica' phytoplasma PP2]|nr:hypothetical protein ['Prunus persica' phytoplasma PP2]